LTYELANPSGNLLAGTLPPSAAWTTAWLRKMTTDIGDCRVCEWTGAIIEKEPIEHAIVSFADGGGDF
jgi:hypothetical protein